MKQGKSVNNNKSKSQLQAFVLATLSVSSVDMYIARDTPMYNKAMSPVEKVVSGEITSDIVTMGYSFPGLPHNPPAKIVGTGTLTMHGSITELDDKVRKLDVNQNYIYNSDGIVFAPEYRKRHYLVGALGNSVIELMGDNHSTYNVDAIVATQGGNISITGKSLTTNLIYMTTPLSTSDEYRKGCNGKISIQLTGDLITHNDDWNAYPRMDGFHYHHSSNLYSRGGIAVNGNNALTIEANKVEARYLRNSDYHGGDGKAKITIKANELVLNRLGRSATTDEGKSDEQWTLGKTGNDKGGMFQFYHAMVDIDVKKARVGGVYPGMQPRKNAVDDRIDIDAGNRAHINFTSPRLDVFLMDGEIRAIDGATVDIIANESITIGSAFAGYTASYKKGLYYYHANLSSEDLPNKDATLIHLKAPTIIMNVACPAEVGAHRQIGFGFTGAAQQGRLIIDATRDIHIKNAWDEVECHGVHSKVLQVMQGGQATFKGGNVKIEGRIELGDLAESVTNGEIYKCGDVSIVGTTIDLDHIECGEHLNLRVLAHNKLCIGSAIVRGKTCHISIGGKDIVLAGKCYDVDGLLERKKEETIQKIDTDKTGHLYVKEQGLVSISIDAGGSLSGRVWGDKTGKTQVYLQDGSIWSHVKHSIVQELNNDGIVDLSDGIARLEVDKSYEGNGLIIIPTQAEKPVLMIQSMAKPNSVLRLGIIDEDAITQIDRLIRVEDTRNLKGFKVSLVSKV